MLKTLLFIAATSTPFITYSNNPENVVEATIDKGLIVEIILKCGRKPNGQISAGIMTYSKFEKLFCSSKMRCTASADAAAAETCGW